MSMDEVPRLVRGAIARLDSAAGELDLDFSTVYRLDTAALGAMEDLAAKAGEKRVAIVLRAVNVDVYRVLKLVKLAPRFGYRT